jgi:hypothetical protein
MLWSSFDFKYEIHDQVSKSGVRRVQIISSRGTENGFIYVDEQRQDRIIEWREMCAMYIEY